MGSTRPSGMSDGQTADVPIAPSSRDFEAAETSQALSVGASSEWLMV